MKFIIYYGDIWGALADSTHSHLSEWSSDSSSDRGSERGEFSRENEKCRRDVDDVPSPPMAASVALHRPIPTQGYEKLDAQGKPSSVHGRNMKKPYKC